MIYILRCAGLVGLIIVALFLIAATASHKTVIHLRNGNVIRIEPASFLGKVFTSSCAVVYQSRNRASAVIKLTDNLQNGPYTIIPSNSGKEILCLYDLEDMGLWLVKVDTEQSFRPFSSGSHLGEIIQSSPWAVEEASTKDWQTMYRCFGSHVISGIQGSFRGPIRLGYWTISIRSYVQQHQLVV